MQQVSQKDGVIGWEGEIVSRPALFYKEAAVRTVCLALGAAAGALAERGDWQAWQVIAAGVAAGWLTGTPLVLVLARWELVHEQWVTRRMTAQIKQEAEGARLVVRCGRFCYNHALLNDLVGFTGLKARDRKDAFWDVCGGYVVIAEGGHGSKTVIARSETHEA